ncbi:hypothetical protein POM88_027130 [Heracleum sosnowskyi]|uniref:Uncharacterized protein n=1 Tax=Heracleum sosnowskyi TaxID=360622 RepID=A0AAD8MP77_9APIA|nr:hypothetical protein POM88_027130 [Heracleum sosnowskyi]
MCHVRSQAPSLSHSLEAFVVMIVEINSVEGVDRWLPFFDKIQNLAKNNPGLMTLRSTDLLPSSWKLDGCCMVTTLSPGVYSKMPLRLSAQRKVGRVQQRYIETTTLKNLKYC